MAIDYDKLLHWPFDEIEHHYSKQDTILYALGAGAGGDPVDPNELRLVYEEGVEALPTLASVLGYPGLWLRDPETGVDWRGMVHAEQGITLERPLPPEGVVRARTRVEEIIDKGEGRGALIYVSRELRDAGTDEVLGTVTATSFCRRDGGFGGPARRQPEPHAIPERPPDLVATMTTLPQAALIYRLSGDFNPIHVDPAVAREAGFERPILHGLCTYAVAARSLIASLCDGDPTLLRRLQARFTSPVFPGESLRTEIWRQGEDEAAYRVTVVEREAIAINNGFAAFAG
jgi:acyl dehydratase